MRQLVIIATILLSVTTPSLAQEQLKVGDSYSGNIKLSSPNGGIYLALPEGTWVLTSLEAYRDQNVNAPMLRGRLVSLNEKQVTGAVSFTAGNDSTGGWLVPNYCSRKDIFFVTAPDKRRGKEIRCWGVNHIGMTPGSNASKSATDFYQWIAKNTVGMPKTMIAVEYYRASGAKYIYAEYFRNPEMDGFPPPEVSTWRESEWHKDRVVGDQKRLQYLEGVKAWGEKWLPIVEAAFNGRPINQRESSPVAPPNPTTIAPIERQLEELKSLFDKKLITEGEYAEKRKAILNKNIP